MQAEEVAALFGLGGTLVGAGVSGWATFFTLQQQNKAAERSKSEARKHLIEERGRAAGEKALSELYALRRHVVQHGDRLTNDEAIRWVKVSTQHSDEAELAAGLMPQAEELRARLKEAVEVVRLKAFAERHMNYPELTTQGAEHAIDLVSAYMRGDPLPDPTALVEEYRSILAEWELEHPPGVDG